MDKAIKKDFSVDKPDKDKDQALRYEAGWDKCKQVIEDITLSKSSISKLERLQQELKFQEKG